MSLSEWSIENFFSIVLHFNQPYTCSRAEKSSIAQLDIAQVDLTMAIQSFVSLYK